MVHLPGVGLGRSVEFVGECWPFSSRDSCFESSGSLPGRTLRIHGTGIFLLHLVDFLWEIVGKYTIVPWILWGMAGLENTGSFQRG